MTRRVYLHVGAPKSGTTYLQRVLRHNEAALARQGVLVAGRTHVELVHAGFVVREDQRLADLPPRAAQAWDRVVTAIHQFDGHTAVLSYELLAGARSEQARRAIESLAPLEVHVVVTCRDLGRSVSSAWQERLKFALTAPLGQWQPRPATAGPRTEWGWRTMDPAEVARRWGSALPASRVHIVTAPRSGGPPSVLWDRFAAACSLEETRVDLQVPVANESLGVKAAEVLRRVNEQDLGPIDGAREQSRWLRDVLAHAVLADLDREPTTISEQQLGDARMRAAAAIALIRESGWQVHGDLEDLQATRREGRLPEEVPADELLDITVKTIVALLLELRGERRGQTPAGPGAADRSGTAGGPDQPARGRVADLVAGLRGDDVRAEIAALQARLDAAEDQVRADRRLHQRVGDLTDLVSELLLPPKVADRKTMRQALRRYRRRSL